MDRRRPLLLALLLLAVALTPAAAQAKPAACASAHVAVVSSATVREAQDATLCLLNRARAQAGLPKLRMNERLSGSADAHSREMVRHRYFAHESLDGTSPFTRMMRTHYVPHHAHSWELGENIGWGSATLAEPIALVRMWMHSPPHRANILSRQFHDIGIGITPGIPQHGGPAGATYTTDFGAHG
jgi:uncharacterized protein YkwD